MSYLFSFWSNNININITINKINNKLIFFGNIYICISVFINKIIKFSKKKEGKRKRRKKVNK